MDSMIDFSALFFYSMTILVMISRGRRIYAITALLAIPASLFVTSYNAYLASIVPFIMELGVHVIVNIVRHELQSSRI